MLRSLFGISSRKLVFWFCWLCLFFRLNTLHAGSSQKGSSTASGTGGIGVVTPTGQWQSARPELPHVTETDSGFKISLSTGQELIVPSGQPNIDRFLTLWWQLHDPRNGYFSPLNIPYHSAETLIVEAPDYGHLTTSETFSYWAWLETSFAYYTHDYSMLRYVYQIIDNYAIPKFQPNVGSHNPESPAVFARENASPKNYPSPLEQQVPIGKDPIADELRTQYGQSIYGMHWLLDTSNWYRFGSQEQPTFINTFQRGTQESVWETVPHPSIEEFKFGAANQGYLSLFVADSAGYKRQWRYTNAPDADARLIQATWQAQEFAKAQGQPEAILDLVGKATRMGDYLRYSMFDKYFKSNNCQSLSCPGAKGFDSAHFLLGWYYSWGGSYPSDTGSWSWRIGASSAHFGYQNPMTAYILSQNSDFRSNTSHGADNWSSSLNRQLEFYQWLQSNEGAIAGGASSSWNGQYASYPPGQSTFYGMAYEEHPVYTDPGSNSWFGWQAWSMQRVAEYYAETGDPRAETLLNRWVAWAIREVQLPKDGSFAIPASLNWTGSPETWQPGSHNRNSTLHVTVTESNQDVGIASALAKTFMFYAKGQAQHKGIDAKEPKRMASELLNRMWTHFHDEKGVSVPEERKDYLRFQDPVFVPNSYQGKMPDGSLINSASTFQSLRSRYAQDPDFAKVQNYIQGGPAPIFRYHRFWAQVEAAMAFAEFNRLIETPASVLGAE
ncbi:MAG: endoglucanase [Proteobacteria bacterium]|nr:endoglucanase [Pseudomonadota bacterium]